MIRETSSQHERSGYNLALLIQHVQARFGNEHHSRILDEGDHRDLPLLAVWLAQPPDYAAGAGDGGGGGGDRFPPPGTPAFFGRESTASLGALPFPTHARARAP